MSQENIDNIIQRSQTSKAIPLSDGAWHRLDDMLTADDQKAKKSKMWWMGIAASFTILGCALVNFFSTSNQEYHLEHLVIEKQEILFSAAEIAFLNEEYQNQNISQLQRRYDENAQVKVTLQ